MPFCPNCRTEYVGDAKQCSDCGAELTDWLPAGTAVSDFQAAQAAELCQVEDQLQADLIEVQLRAAGIPCARRPRKLALFVPSARLADAQRVLAGQPPATAAESLGLSELHRIRLVCESCEKVTPVDLLTESVPSVCSCGHYFDLTAVRPVLDRYTGLMRTLTDADFEIELEPPAPEE